MDATDFFADARNLWAWAFFLLALLFAYCFAQALAAHLTLVMLVLLCQWAFCVAMLLLVRRIERNLDTVGGAL